MESTLLHHLLVVVVLFDRFFGVISPQLLSPRQDPLLSSKPSSLENSLKQIIQFFFQIVSPLRIEVWEDLKEKKTFKKIPINIYSLIFYL